MGVGSEKWTLLLQRNKNPAYVVQDVLQTPLIMRDCEDLSSHRDESEVASGDFY
jgi:hypothetical protein